jgi:hypothetical protein
MCFEHYELWKIKLLVGRSHLAARSSNPKIKVHRRNEFAGSVYNKIFIERFCIYYYLKDGIDW